MTAAALSGAFLRYWSNGLLRETLESAHTSAYWREVLAEHIKHGALSYKIEGHPTDPFLSVVHLPYSALVNQINDNPLSVDVLSNIVHQHAHCLTNVVAHQPFIEFCGGHSADQPNPDIDDLKGELDLYPQWVDYLRGFYRSNQMAGAQRSAQLSIGLDIMRIIQASQEKHALDEDATPFERHDMTDINSMMATLHNAMLSFHQEGVFRGDLPVSKEWLRLYFQPDMSASCSPQGYYLPIPSLSAFEQISMETQEAIPERMYFSPDVDTLLHAMADVEDRVQWGILGHEGYQTVLVKPANTPNKLQVYSVLLNREMVRHAGELDPRDPATWEFSFTSMIDESRIVFEKEEGYLSKVVSL